MPESDVSGDLIDADAGARIVTIFDDGTRRRLTVTSAEAARVRQRGVDETTRGSRVAAFAAANGKKVLFWMLALFVASWPCPLRLGTWRTANRRRR